MPEIAFAVKDARAESLAASPQVAFTVVLSAPGTKVQSVLLRAFVRVEAGHRNHSEAERARLGELFGEGELFHRTNRSLLWAQVTSVVPAFTEETTFELLVPCSVDLAYATSRYLHALDGGTVTLRFQWSGTAFIETDRGLVAAPIPWSRESEFGLPVSEFRRAVDAHFPGLSVLTLRRDVFDALERYRRREGLVRAEDAVVRLLEGATDGGPR